ncbi:MAG: T9SS type A sorting domain-containing protein [Flavobacteriales bacterium]|nr:T9SS type A sorting domain-containing protein [Flavobacteriales bacterium]
MARLLTVLLITAFASAIHAQNNTSSIDAPDWVELMKDGDMTYQEIVDLHNSYWEGKEITRGCGWKPFKRWEYLMQYRLDAAGYAVNGGDIAHVSGAYHLANAYRSPAGNWEQLGPILDDLTTREDINGVGRTSCVAFHPTNPDIIFVGTPAAGVWRSYDGGQSWETNTDNFLTLGVSALAFDPVNPDIVYLGTGDRDASDSPGMGVMKSTDGGLNWSFVNGGMESLNVGCLIVKADEPNVVLAGTNDGIFRSEDFGETWVYNSPNSTDYRQMVTKPGDPNTIYATANGKYFRTTDGGQNWEWINEGLSGSNRMVLAVTPANPELVYICAATTYEFKEFYRSTNGGTSFESMAEEPNLLGWAADGSSDGGQAWYDLCMTADVEGNIYLGGIRMKKSSDGGATWTDINPDYLHVDQHECAISPHNNDLYLCNDGGFYHYVNNQEWLDISEGIINGQIYRMGQSALTGAKALTGFQDNGTAEWNGIKWQRRGGGDGFECWYDHTDENYRYGSIYYGRIFRTGPEYYNQQVTGMDVLGINEEGAWYSPYILSRWDENHMFVGLKNVWRCTNIKHPIKDSLVWEKISNNLGNNNTWNMVALVQSRSDQNTLWCSQGNARIFKCQNALDEDPQWLNLGNFLPLASSPVVAIETHPTDTGIVYIAYNTNVYRSADGGFSWEDISSGIPPINVNTLVYDVNSDEGLYVGTDMGIYYKDASMDSFIEFSDGFPANVRVTELEIFQGDSPAESRLRAATYGRGLWESDLFDPETYVFPAIASVRAEDDAFEVYADFEAQVSFYRNLNIVEVSGFEDVDIFVENATLNGVSGGPVEFTLDLTPTTFGPVKIYVENNAATDTDGIPTTHSDTLFLMYNPVPEPFGIYGPGGVGDEETIALWLRADRGVMWQGAQQTTNGSVDQWLDQSGQGAEAVQSTAAAQPILGLGSDGIYGRPAIVFDGEDDYLMAENIVPGQNLSVFSLAKGENIQFNTHGWIASARMPNGFVLHPWKNESQYSSMVIDMNEDYANGSKEYIGDAAGQHIYGVVYEQTDYYQFFSTLFDERKLDWGGAEIGERSEDQSIDIKYGWDYDDRFGEGRIAEHFIYNRRVHRSHWMLAINYLAVKYGIDLGLQRRYAQWDQPLNVAGIGQETFYDYHHDAQGTGIVRMNNASDMDNGEYLLWGDDEASMDIQSDGYPIESARVFRTWGYDQTGDVGTVSVSIMASEVPDFGAPIGVIVGDEDAFLPSQQLDFFPLTLVGDVWQAEVQFSGAGVFTIGVEPVVGVAEFTERAVAIYPNPTTGLLTLDWSRTGSGSVQIQIFDAVGRIVFEESSAAIRQMVDLSAWAEGKYTVRLISNEGTVIKDVIKL